MTKTTEHAGEPRKERVEALVRIEDNVAEAAEAAADAAAHAVEATQAAEAASIARTTKKATQATTAKAAKAAKTARSKAGKAARVAKAASAATAPDASLPQESTQSIQTPTHALEVRLTGDELAKIERMAAQQELPVPALARSLLVRALNRSRTA